MVTVLLSTLKTVALLLLYIAIGFILGRKNILGERAGKTLASLLTFLVMPLFFVFNLSKTVTVANISLYAVLFLAGLVLAIVSLAVAIPLSRIFIRKGYLRNVYTYMLFVPNLGYFGYPLVQAVFGDEMLAMYMIFALPLNIILNTYGYMILTDKSAEEGEAQMVDPDARRRDILKRLFSAPMIGTFVGIIIGLLPVELPAIAYEFIQPVADCMRAIAMLLTGVVLSQLTFKALFTSKKAYLFSAVRLIGCPVVFGGLAYLFYRFGMAKEILIFTVCLTALPAGLNVVVFPEAIGMSGKEGAQACFISYLLVIVTLPLMLAAMMALL